MNFLKQSTASQAVLLGPFVDATDGATAETGLAIANTDIRLSANGGNMVAKNSGGGTHDENGWYAVTFDATDTATVGRLQVSCVVAGALPVFMEFQVIEEAVYDALFAASATGALPSTLVEGGINTASGTITTLDGLDTAQDSQHAATQAAVEIVQDLLEYEAQQSTATFSDTFTRSTINPDWTKSASNPLTAAGYGDPFVYHDGTNFNVFCDDLGTGNIVVFSSADPEVLGAASVALSVPSGFTYVRDPYVILDDGTYYLFFSHQLSSGATSSSIGIGVATSSTLTGPYTVQSTDLITRASDSVNEPSVIRDGQYWKCYVTAGTSGTLDIGAEDIAYFSAANLLGPWQDCGNAIIEDTTPDKWQDQEVIKIGQRFVMLMNNGNADIVYSHSEDGHVWSTPTILETRGAGGAFDDGGVYAPTLVEVSGTWYIYYQGNDGGSENKLGLATVPSIVQWMMSDSSYWECTGTKLRKKNSNQSNWEGIYTDIPFDPTYTFAATLNIESVDEAGYTLGVWFASNTSRKYLLLINATDNTAAIWETLQPSTTFNHVITTASHTFTTGVDYAISIQVSDTTVKVTIDGTTVFDLTGFRFTKSQLGFFGYAFSTVDNHFTVDDVSITEATTAEDNVLIGSTRAYAQEMKEDWEDGGRLDSLLDTAASGGGGGNTVNIDMNIQDIQTE